MQRTLLEFPLAIANVGELLALDRKSGAVHQWKHDQLLGQLCAGPGHELRLVVLEVPKYPDVSAPADERAVATAREDLHMHLVPLLSLVPGAKLSALRELSDAIEQLIAARIGRALRIHCDADHSDDD